MSVVETVARKLGGAAVLGQEVRSQADLASVVQGRLPLAALKRLSGAGVSSAEIERFIIPEHTRRHRAEEQQPLTVDESDRAVRLLLLQTIAEETFGDPKVAACWLRRPLGELAGAAPLDVGQTPSGCPRRRDDPWRDRLGCCCLMDLWRLSGAVHARAFDGGYGRRLALEGMCLS